MNCNILDYNEQDLDYLLILFKRIVVDDTVQGRVLVETHEGAICSFFFDSVEPLQGLASLYKTELSTLRIMDEATDIAYSIAA